MNDDELISGYNYDAFTPEKALPRFNFENSPRLGEPAPDIPLRHLDGRQMRLAEIWSVPLYTIVEFGSFS